MSILICLKQDLKEGISALPFALSLGRTFYKLMFPTRFGLETRIRLCPLCNMFYFESARGIYSDRLLPIAA